MYRNGFLRNADVAVYEPLINSLFSKKAACDVERIFAEQPDFVADAAMVKRFEQRIQEGLFPGYCAVEKKSVANVRPEDLERIATDTLVTKILLGVFALTPAFDTFFKQGVLGFFKPPKSDQKGDESHQKHSDIPSEKLKSLPEGHYSLGHIAEGRAVIKRISYWDEYQHEWIPKFLADPGVRAFFEQNRPRFNIPGHLEEPYPLMRCIDLLFFSTGAFLEGKHPGSA